MAYKSDVVLSFLKKDKYVVYICWFNLDVSKSSH